MRNPKAHKVAKPRVLSPDIRGLAEVYFTSLDCPRSLSLYILLKYDEFDQVARMRANPADYLLAPDFHLAALATDFLRKYPGLPVSVDPEKEAIKSWYQSEAECRAQNEKALRPEVKLLCDVAADFIQDVLGACPLDLTPKFGPGATASDPAKRSTVLDKVTSRPTVTNEALLLLDLWKGTAWERSHLESDGYKKSSYEAEIVEGNTFFTVPKTATIKRGCSKGPSINLSYQLAVGTVIRERLRKRLGLDLANGQLRHNSLAREGSLTGNLATLDSERASDTMSTSTVMTLLSKSGFWPDLLWALREPKTKIEGTWTDLDKFSAMGNGYTFELETLIFLSLCYAVAWSHEISGELPGYPGMRARDLVRIGHITVYGDDVIVPAFMARDVASVLTELGFTINLKKSYFDGEFRESCGGDYFRGHAVQTVKISDEVNQPADWFSIHNAVKDRFIDQYPCLNTSRVLAYIKSQLPRQYRNLYGPKSLGDLVLHGFYGPQIRAKARPVKTEDGILREDPNQWVAVLKVLTPRRVIAKMHEYSGLAQLAYILYTMRCEPPTRRPVTTLRYDVVDFEMDYHVCFEDYVPRAPSWLCSSPYASYFGIRQDGTYVG